MKDLEIEALKLGIPVKTRHNEAVSYTHLDVYKRQDYWFNTQVETGIDDDGETIFATNKYFKYGAHSTAHVRCV